jgi:hypothetical protein
MQRTLLTIILVVGSSQALAAQNRHTLLQTSYRILPRDAGAILPPFLEGGALHVAGDTLIWQLKESLALASFRTVGDTLQLVDIPGGNLVCGPMTGAYRLLFAADTITPELIADDCEGRRMGLTQMRLVPNR